MKNWSLARRDLLKRLGLGAACLPLLRARRARAASPRRHLVIIQMTQGYRQAYWKPPTGALATLPPTLAPMGPFEQDLIVLPGLTNPSAGISGRGAYGVMFYGLGATGTTYKEPTGPTLDQVVGAALPGAGGRRSLNLSVMLDRPPQLSTMPGAKYCFWTGAGQPIKPLGDPYAVYRELFGAANMDTPEARRLMLRRKSILDYVGTELDEYGKRSGTPEQQVVEGHLQAIRDLETQLQAVSQSAACGPDAPPPGAVDLNADRNYPIILDLQMKMMVAALKCGLTNVVTLQLSDASAMNVDLAAFIPGLPTGGTAYKSPIRSWRDIGHNPVVNGVDLKKIVELWFMQRMAGLLQQVRGLAEDGGSLFDHTVVLMGNHMEDGGSTAQRIPWMLAGNGGGWLNTGNCLPSEGQSITKVMAGICEALGVTAHPYGDVLPGLKKV
jgi:hypothetical protein